MTAPCLLVRKAMVTVGGKTRPVVQVQAVFAPVLAQRLDKDFGTELLFRRAAYANGFPEGSPRIAPGLAPHLGAFVKNDACPEITVKSMLASQTFQSNTLWEMMAFEYVAERAFDNLCEIAAAVLQLGTERHYRGAAADLVAFSADGVDDAA